MSPFLLVARAVAADAGDATSAVYTARAGAAAAIVFPTSLIVS